MGGSLAAALSKQNSQIKAYDPDHSALQYAAEHGWIHQHASSAVEAVAQAQLVILAAPVRIIAQQLRDLAGHFPSGCVVMDLGSTKSDICREMENLPGDVIPIGGHPMCGKEISGIQAAQADLFHNQVFIFCPLKRTPPDAVALAQELAQVLGARPLFLTPEENDSLAATASHLPFLLSAGLVETARKTAQVDSRLWQVTASGYRDTSRLAASDVNMMTDILLSNAPAILQALDRCQVEFSTLRQLILESDEPALRKYLTTVQQSRKEWKQ